MVGPSNKKKDRRVALSGNYPMYCIDSPCGDKNAILADIKGAVDIQKTALKRCGEAIISEIGNIYTREQEKICVMVKNLQEAMQKIHRERQNALFEERFVEVA